MWCVMLIMPLIMPRRGAPNMLPANVTVSGAVIRKVKPYSSANITMAAALCEMIISPKQAMRARKQSAVGSRGVKAVGEQARGHDAEQAQQAHERVEAAGECGAQSLVLREGDDMGGDEEVLEAADGVHHEQQPELA